MGDLAITPCHPVPHTIVLPGADHGGEANGQGAVRTRLHAVRGHFATYTSEAPLFVKLVGTYWRPWHLSGNPERGWQSLDEHLKIIGRIILVARQFGAKPTAQFPHIVELANADNFRLSDEALMCCDGNLEVESSHFQRPDRGHRTSPLFRVSLKLHSIESARARYNAWAAEQWDNSHSGPGQSYLVDGKLVPIAKPKNPYRESTNSK